MVVAEAVVLKNMSARSTWIEVLENQENKKIIDQSFKRIDEYTKDFHVRVSCPPWETNLLIPFLQLNIVIDIERNTNKIQESLAVCLLKRFPDKTSPNASASNSTSRTGPALVMQPTTQI